MADVNFKADTSLHNNAKTLFYQLRQAGWRYRSVEIDQGHGYKVTKFGAYVRDIENPLLLGRNNEKNFSNDATAEKKSDVMMNKESSNDAGFGGVKLVGVEMPYGRPQGISDPQANKALIKTLGDIPSVALMRDGLGDSLVIAIDTEYYYGSDGRKILTWQFAFVSFDNTVIHEVVFYSLDGQRLTLGLSLSWLVYTYGLYCLPFSKLDNKGYYYRDTRRWVVPVKDVDGKTVMKSCLTYKEALEVCNDEVYLGRLKDAGCRHKKNLKKENDVGYINDFREFNPSALSVTLLFHTAIADLTGFGFEDFDKDVLSRVSSVGGGLVSLQGFYIHPITPERYWTFYPIAISIRDSMCFAPAKQKSLESLGKAIGVPKLTLMDGYSKDDMLRYLLEQPAAFMEYAINDAVVTLLYASSMWGYLTEMPVTLSSAAVRAAVPVIKRYFGLKENDKKGFNFMFKGLKTVKKGIIPRHDRPGYLEDTAMVPVSDDAKQIQSYAKDAFKGGYNGCLDVGWYEGLTYDYDLRNAYPTSMALTMDIDWSSEKVIAREWRNERMLLEDFKSPYDPIFGYFRFKFPENVKYPCIAVGVEGSLLYPRTFEKGDAEMDGVYAAGPEIYLALCLGAEVTAVRAVKGKYRVNPDGYTVSRSLRAAVKNLINDRNLAKEVFGEGSLAETLLKTAVNSLYGKTAQDIIEKDTWDAFRQMMVNIGCSQLTSPTHASIITAGVRAILLAAMNELDSLGYRVYSVTTDGFISNAPPEVIQRLSLFGFRVLFEEAREALVGDPTIWQLKHAQTSLLNFSTRGNVALNTEENSVVVNGKGYAGVCAHNSFVTGYELDSYEDRLSLTKTVLSRTKKCTCVNKSFTRFKEVSKPRSQRKDFLVSQDSRDKSMDFDVKRKPLKETMETVNPVIDGETYAIVNFETAAFETVDEYLAYRKVAQACARSGCLRTMGDWEKFFLKLDNMGNPDSENRSSGCLRVTDMEWSKIMTLILGYRLGYWDIPYLSEDIKLDEKIKYINSLNKSSKKFTKNNWKNCRRENRKGQMLDKKYIKDLLLACGAKIFGDKVS